MSDFSLSVRWREHFAQVFATDAHLSLPKFRRLTKSNQYIASLFAAAFVCENTVFPKHCTYADQLVQKALALVPMVSMSSEQLYIIGVVWYTSLFCPNGQTQSDFIPCIIHHLKEYGTFQGSEIEQDGLYFHDVVQSVSALLDSIQSSWTTRFDKWTNLSTREFLKKSEHEKEQIQHIMNGTIAHVSATAVADARRALFSSVVLFRDVHSVCHLEQSSLAFAKQSFQESKTNSEEMWKRLQVLERQYHAMSEDYKVLKTREQAWEMQVAEAQATVNSRTDEIESCKQKVQELAQALQNELVKFRQLNTDLMPEDVE